GAGLLSKTCTTASASGEESSLAPRVIARTGAILPPSKTRRTAAARVARFPRWRRAYEGPSWHRLLVPTLDRWDRPGRCMRAGACSHTVPRFRAALLCRDDSLAVVAGAHPPAGCSAGGDPEGAFFASLDRVVWISALDRSCQNMSSARSAKTQPRALKCEPGSVRKYGSSS